MVPKPKRVGRPEKTDSDGNPILTKVINVNAPVRLIEYLKDNGVNRSELFSKVAASYYAKEICPECFDKLSNTTVGSHCETCGHNYWKRTRENKCIFRRFNDCPNCKEPYSYENLWAQSEQGLDGCQKCGVKK